MFIRLPSDHSSLVPLQARAGTSTNKQRDIEPRGLSISAVVIFLYNMFPELHFSSPYFLYVAISVVTSCLRKRQRCLTLFLYVPIACLEVHKSNYLFPYMYNRLRANQFSDLFSGQFKVSLRLRNVRRLSFRRCLRFTVAFSFVVLVLV